jgi:hypothetical protein
MGRHNITAGSAHLRGSGKKKEKRGCVGVSISPSKVHMQWCHFLSPDPTS